MVLRPDEMASLRQLEEQNKSVSAIKNVGKTAVGTALGVAGASALPKVIEKISPFLSEYIPTDLAIKGISKVSPEIGSFLQRGQKAGLDIKEGIDFLTGKIEQTKQAQPKDDRNVIEKYSPELFQWIKDKVGKGTPVLQAAALARLPTTGQNFDKVIKKMEADNKTDWSAIVESVFGTEQQPQQTGKSQTIKEVLSGNTGMSQGIQPTQPMQGMQQQGQPGPGQQALMAILQQINQKLGQ